MVTITVHFKCFEKTDMKFCNITFQMVLLLIFLLAYCYIFDVVEFIFISILLDLEQCTKMYFKDLKYTKTVHTIQLTYR